MKSKKIIAALLTASLILAMGTGCSKKETSSKTSFKVPEQTQADIQAPTVQRANGQTPIFELSSGAPSSISEDELTNAYSQFVFGLLSQCAGSTNDNLMISPDSVLFALDMAAAGANGNTLEQMLQVTMPNADSASAFQFAVNRMAHLRGNQLQIANSAWFNQDRSAPFYEDYLNFIHDTFDSEVSMITMDDHAVPVINDWISEHTKGRIPKMLEYLDPDTACILVNAMVFDGKWKESYDEDHVYDGDFRQSSGETQKVTFLLSDESRYVSNDSAQGFVKLYDGDQYAFMTILPNDDSIAINEYVSNMTAEDYWSLWNSMSSQDVISIFPEFTSTYRTDMVPFLQKLGMTEAFTGNADFSNMSEVSPFISQVLHQTYIKVDRNGTEAAAVTVVTMEDGCALAEPSPIVKCDRPFAYAIVDMDTGLPVFIGTVNSVESPS